MDDSGFKIRLSAIEKLSKEKVQGHVVKERDRIMREVMRLQIEHYKIKEKESYEQEIDKKRSKSENISENKVNINEIVVKDIISFIQSREKNLPPFEPAKAVIKK